MATTVNILEVKEYYLTLAQYREKEAAGTLEENAKYYITDDFPNPTSSDVGKILVVGESGEYKLAYGEEGGTFVDLPEGDPLPTTNIQNSIYRYITGEYADIPARHDYNWTVGMHYDISVVPDEATLKQKLYDNLVYSPLWIKDITDAKEQEYWAFNRVYAIAMGKEVNPTTHEFENSEFVYYARIPHVNATIYDSLSISTESFDRLEEAWEYSNVLTLGSIYFPETLTTFFVGGKQNVFYMYSMYRDIVTQKEITEDDKLNYMTRFLESGARDQLVFPIKLDVEPAEFIENCDFSFIGHGAVGLVVNNLGQDLIPASMEGWQNVVDGKVHKTIENDTETNEKYGKDISPEIMSIQNYKLVEFTLSDVINTAKHRMVYDPSIPGWRPFTNFTEVEVLPTYGYEGEIFKVKSPVEENGYDYYIYTGGEFVDLLGESLQAPHTYTEELNNDTPVSSFTATILINPSTRMCYYDDSFVADAHFVIQRLPTDLYEKEMLTRCAEGICSRYHQLAPILHTATAKWNFYRFNVETGDYVKVEDFDIPLEDINGQYRMHVSWQGAYQPFTFNMIAQCTNSEHWGQELHFMFEAMSGMTWEQWKDSSYNHLVERGLDEMNFMGPDRVMIGGYPVLKDTFEPRREEDFVIKTDKITPNIAYKFQTYRWIDG